MKTSGEDSLNPLVPLRWMYMLAGFTACLCVGEILVGYRARSLALLGDAGHALLDLVSYIAAILFESFKSVARGNRKVVAALDLFICIFAIITVVASTVFVWDAALIRLVGGVHKHEAERAVGFEAVWQDILEPKGDHGGPADVDGRLVFVFALCSVTMNGILGYHGYQYVQNAHGTWWDWAHSLLHPGCTQNHSVRTHFQHGPGCDCEEDAMQSAPLNLNVVVMWVHVVSDAVKDCVLIVVSFLMMLHVVSSHAADAASALAVTVLVVLGSFWVVPAIWVRIKQVFFNAELTLETEEDREGLLEDGRKEKLTATYNQAYRRNLVE
jgi:Co/Zn/Cd efflux system component